MPASLILMLLLGLTFVVLAKLNEKYNSKPLVIGGIAIIVLEVLLILEFADEVINLITL